MVAGLGARSEAGSLSHGLQVPRCRSQWAQTHRRGLARHFPRPNRWQKDPRLQSHKNIFPWPFVALCGHHRERANIILRGQGHRRYSRHRRCPPEEPERLGWPGWGLGFRRSAPRRIGNSRGCGVPSHEWVGRWVRDRRADGKLGVTKPPPLETPPLCVPALRRSELGR